MMEMALQKTYWPAKRFPTGFTKNFGNTVGFIQRLVVTILMILFFSDSASCRFAECSETLWDTHLQPEKLFGKSLHGHRGKHCEVYSGKKSNQPNNRGWVLV